MNSDPLYKIAADLVREIEANIVEAEDGALLMPVGVDLDAIYSSFNAKVEACAAAMRHYEAMATVAEAEAKRLYDRASSLHRRREWLKEYVKQNMLMVGQERVEGDLFTVSLRGTPPKVTLLDEASIPGEFWKEEIKRSVVKADILKAWKSGLDIPGVAITTDKTVVVK